MTTDRAMQRDRLGVVAESARRLATAGPAALPAVVTALRDALSVPASVVIRACDQTAPAGDARDGAVLAAAHPAVLPRPRAVGCPAALIVPVTVAAAPACVVSVVAAADLDPTDRLLVAAHADLVGLALAAARPHALLAGLILDEEAERAEIAAELRESAVGSLVAARHAIATGSDGPTVDAVVALAMRELGRVVAAQRAGGSDGDLIRALRGLVDELRASGRQARLSITGLPRGGVSPACAVVAYRTVAAAVDGAAGRPVIAVAGHADGAFAVTVTGAIDPYDAGALDRWSRRARALGGDFERRRDGVAVRLPLRLADELPRRSTRAARSAPATPVRPFGQPFTQPSRQAVASSGAVS